MKQHHAGEKHMAFTDWMIRGPEIATCNAPWMPCQFNHCHRRHLPGGCRHAHREGSLRQVKLDGLNAATPPGPAPSTWARRNPAIVDERATEQQREALLKIMSGQDTEPGATFFNVFVSMCDKVHTPMFKKIEFKSNMKTCEGHFSVPGVVEAKTEAIRNPVTGKPHHAKISLRQGFEFVEAEFASGTAKSAGPIKLDTNGRHAHLATLHLTGKGIVH
jgi:hypothetical protein